MKKSLKLKTNDLDLATWQCFDPDCYFIIKLQVFAYSDSPIIKLPTPEFCPFCSGPLIQLLDP